MSRVEKEPDVIVAEAERAVDKPEANKEKSAIKLDSIHIKEERFSVANKTGMAFNYQVFSI